MCLYVCGVSEHNPKEQVFSTTVGLGHQIQVIRVGSEHLYLTSTCRGQRTTSRVSPPFLLFLRPGLSWPQSSRKGQEGVVDSPVSASYLTARTWVLEMSTFPLDLGRELRSSSSCKKCFYPLSQLAISLYYYLFLLFIIIIIIYSKIRAWTTGLAPP